MTHIKHFLLIFGVLLELSAIMASEELAALKDVTEAASDVQAQLANQAAEVARQRELQAAQLEWEKASYKKPVSEPALEVGKGRITPAEITPDQREYMRALKRVENIKSRMQESGDDIEKNEAKLEPVKKYIDKADSYITALNKQIKTEQEKLQQNEARLKKATGVGRKEFKTKITKSQDIINASQKALDEIEGLKKGAIKEQGNINGETKRLQLYITSLEGYLSDAQKEADKKWQTIAQASKEVEISKPVAMQAIPVIPPQPVARIHTITETETLKPQRGVITSESSAKAAAKRKVELEQVRALRGVSSKSEAEKQAELEQLMAGPSYQKEEVKPAKWTKPGPVTKGPPKAIIGRKPAEPLPELPEQNYEMGENLPPPTPEELASTSKLPSTESVPHDLTPVTKKILDSVASDVGQLSTMVDQISKHAKDAQEIIETKAIQTGLDQVKKVAASGVVKQN